MSHNNPIVRANMKRKYGVEYAMQSSEIKEKHRQVFLKKYGKSSGAVMREKGLLKLANLYNLDSVSNCMTIPEIREKTKSSLEKRYGVGIRNPSQIPGMEERKRRNYLQKHGFEHNLSDPSVRESIKLTNALRKQRTIVSKIISYLEENSTRAKDQGLHNNWKQASDEYLKAWCDKNQFSYRDEDFK